MTAFSLQVRLGPLTLSNPVLVAAGTFGYGLEFARVVRLEELGGLITKTLTRRPRDGHPPPRLVETPSGMLNAVGLQNIGLDAFLREKLPTLRRCSVPVIVSVLADDADDVAAMVAQLDCAEGVAGIELNLSCPNVKHHSAGEVGGRRAEAEGAGLHPPPSTFHLRMVAQDPDATRLMVETARRHTQKLLIAKLSPDVTDLAPIAQAAERAGAHALSIGNTFTGMSLDPEARRSRLGMLTGGLSGPAIRPLAIYRVWYTAQIVRIPIVGVGGIVRAQDALEFILAGACAVGIGTATFADPRAALRILRGLERYGARHRLQSLDELRGAIHQTTACS